MLKKMLKNVLSIMVVVCVLAGCLGTTVAGAETSKTATEMADALKAIGLFSGTSTGYELERAATRIEAATMMVRILGKEEEAKAMHYEHPFTDVPTWANDYVGYMYFNKLSLGIGNDLFGSTDVVTGDSYMTFMLRALGYNDSDGDFSYLTALEFARTHNIISTSEKTSLSAKPFLRGGMVVVSYRSLQAKLKNSQTALIDQLITDEVVVDIDAVLQGIASVGKYRSVLQPEIIYSGEMTDVDLSQKDFRLEDGYNVLRSYNIDDEGIHTINFSVPYLEDWDDTVVAKLEFYNDGKLLKTLYDNIDHDYSVTEYSVSFYYTTLAELFTSVKYSVYKANDFYLYTNYPNIDVHRISISNKQTAIDMMKNASYINVNWYNGNTMSDDGLILNAISYNASFYPNSDPYYVRRFEGEVQNGYKNKGKVLNNQGDMTLFTTKTDISQFNTRHYEGGEQINVYTVLVNLDDNDAFILRDANYQVTDIILFTN
ncbi:MAG: hypothetical protein PF505_03620 [Vallitaleaceae bacterium]|jgi:hypothetical protein|nr:hypothetical protein [Vallitaleaceae bacterium]